MGRKKKFIDKKQASTFHVVHRSQQDKTKEGEEDASKFVLIPSVRPRDDRGQDKRDGDDQDVSGEGTRFAGKRNHINALGFPNDGYDYEQHIKSMGGGTFVTKSGKVDHFAAGSAGSRAGGAALTIPVEALPSEEVLDRQLEAVTISEKVMDSDMRKALAGELYGVEEDSFVDENNLLDDDFVIQAAGADDGEVGFDFDAHVARLMDASARETGLRERTAEDDLEMKGLARLRKGGGGSSYAGSDLDAESDRSGEFDETLLEGLNVEEGQGGGGDVGVLGEGTEERAVLDSQFEATLAAYDSDEWGELEEDDERVKGQWDPEQHQYANRCLDEFLANKEEANWVDGFKRLPLEQRAITVETLVNGDAVGNPSEGRGDETGTEAGKSPGEVVGVVGGLSASGPRLGKLRGLGREGLEDEEGDQVEEDDDEEGIDDFLDDIGRHNEYLRERQPELWDCETIVSTYSNLDNHPSVLGTGRKAKPRKPRGPLASENAGGVSSVADASISIVTKVVLSEKTGIPLGVLPERVPNERGMISLTAGKNFGEKRDAEETVEEKRQRKAKIKEEKRDKRAQKKGIKMAFAAEAEVVKHALANPEAPQNRSVFNYS